MNFHNIKIGNNCMIAAELIVIRNLPLISVYGVLFTKLINSIKDNLNDAIKNWIKIGYLTRKIIGFKKYIIK